MGFSGISFSSLLMIFAVVILIFGSKRLGRIGQEIGQAVKHFRHGLRQGQGSKQNPNTNEQQTDPNEQNPSSRS